MNKIIKKIILMFIIVLMVIIPCRVVVADSGFDYDYDSGGSDWSSSSYDSDYSSSDYSSSSYSGSGTTSDAEFVFYLLIFIMIIFYAIFISIKEAINRSIHPVITSPKYEFDKMSDDKIKEIDSSLDTDKILDKTFDLYYQLQNAWMEFDNDSIRNLVSDELYNNYKMQLNNLKIRGHKNIMEDITKVGGFVVAVRKDVNVESVDVVLNITMKDYIVSINGTTVRGDKIPKGIAYLITIDRAIDSNSHITNCPNCGDKVSDAASQKCSSCGADLVTYSKDFIITKKQNIGQGNASYRFMPKSGSVQEEININKYDSSIDNSMFKTKVDNIFIQLYNGISNGDLIDVKHKISDKVYDKYQIEVDKNNKDNLKHVFGELNVTSTKILSVDDKDNMIIVKVELVSRYMDYFVNKDTNDYVKGINTHRVEHKNYLTLFKKKNVKDMKANLYCPGCGKPANVNETGHCSYCGAIFNTEDYDYILSDIEVK